MPPKAQKKPAAPKKPTKPSAKSKTGNTACSQAASNWQLAIRGKEPLDPQTYATLAKCRSMTRTAKQADDRARMGYNLNEQGAAALKGRLQKRFDQGLITQKSRDERLKTLLQQRKEKQAAVAAKPALRKNTDIKIADLNNMSIQQRTNLSRAEQKALNRESARQTPESYQKAIASARQNLEHKRSLRQPPKPAFSRQGQQASGMPPRTADTMSEAIAISSPNGRMSKRTKDAATKRLSTALFGPNGLQGPQVKQPTEIERLRRDAANLRDLASRGLKPRAHAKLAGQLEARAIELEKTLASPKFSRQGQLAPGRGTEERRSMAALMLKYRKERIDARLEESKKPNEYDLWAEQKRTENREIEQVITAQRKTQEQTRKFYQQLQDAEGKTPALVDVLHSNHSRVEKEYSYKGGSGTVALRILQEKAFERAKALHSKTGHPYSVVTKYDSLAKPLKVLILQAPQNFHDNQFEASKAGFIFDLEKTGKQRDQFKHYGTISKTPNELPIVRKTFAGEPPQPPQPKPFSRGGQLAPGRGTEERKQAAVILHNLRSRNNDGRALARTIRNDAVFTRRWNDKRHLISSDAGFKSRRILEQSYQQRVNAEAGYTDAQHAANKLVTKTGKVKESAIREANIEYGSNVGLKQNAIARRLGSLRDSASRHLNNYRMLKQAGVSETSYIAKPKSTKEFLKNPLSRLRNAITNRK